MNVEPLKNIWDSLLHWRWSKSLLHWIIISAGTMAECVFLIASLWVSVNANVHKFVLLFINEDTTIHLTELATTAYVALPECIVALAVVTTLSHLRMVRVDKRAIIWSILFGLPTLVFLVLSLVTLWNAVQSVTFEMPAPLVSTRALAGYTFAFASLLYTQIGIPQEKDRLSKKDELIADLRNEMAQSRADLIREKEEMLTALVTSKDAKIAELQNFIQQISHELSQQKELLTESKTVQSELLKAVNKSSEDALAGYSEACKEWIKSGTKTVLIDEITKFTGHSKRKIASAITNGILAVSSRNKDLILISSLIEWLKNTPPILSLSETNNGAKPDPLTTVKDVFRMQEMEVTTDALDTVTVSTNGHTNGHQKGS
jgi:hypothetical protein